MPCLSCHDKTQLKSHLQISRGKHYQYNSVVWAIKIGHATQITNLPSTLWARFAHPYRAPFFARVYSKFVDLYLDFHGFCIRKSAQCYKIVHKKA